jgi:hypothetical protein
VVPIKMLITLFFIVIFCSYICTIKLTTTMELKNVKKALFIENGFFDDMKGHFVYDLYEKLESNGVECIIIDQASQKKVEVFQNANSADLIAFASTFLYESEVKGIGDLLKNVKSPKMILGQVVGGNSLLYYVDKIWSIEELSQLSHHRLFEIISNPHYDENFTEELDLTFYPKELERLEQERIQRNKGFRKTGRRVKIKTLQAVGKQWSNLKEGNIVDELDCSSIDPNPNRGTWVMGLEEPVKLLNDSGYEEWEYEDLKASALTREFFSRGSMLHQTELMKVVSDWIKNVSGKLNATELWEWCDNLCNTVGVERRGNRSYFERRLKEYKGKYTYFKEPS